MSTRSSYITQTQKSQEFFSDFLDNFDEHPISKGLAKVTNENAVKQSIKNLIFTNLGERLYQPTIGSNVYRTLFEPSDVITAENLANYIKSTLRNNEPRAQVIRINVYSVGDGGQFKVDIIFSLINSFEPITLNFILRRVR
jgi:phage baseplate assembly protein W